MQSEYNFRLKIKNNRKLSGQENSYIHKRIGKSKKCITYCIPRISIENSLYEFKIHRLYRSDLSALVNYISSDKSSVENTCVGAYIKILESYVVHREIDQIQVYTVIDAIKALKKIESFIYTNGLSHPSMVILKRKLQDLDRQYLRYP